MGELDPRVSGRVRDDRAPDRRHHDDGTGPRRLPGMRLAEGYAPTYIASYFFRGLETLDVTW